MRSVARILIVDDDPDIAELVQIRLRAKGHKTILVTNSAEALEIVVQKGAPDVAVLDIDMPGLTGIDLLARIREEVGDPRLPAVFLSGRVRPEDVEAGRALGAGYLTKPFVANALLKAVDEAIRPAPDAEAW